MPEADAFVPLEHFVDQAAPDRRMALEHTRACFGARLVDAVKALGAPDLD